MAKKDGKTTSLVPTLRFPEFRDAPDWNAINGNKLFDLIDRRPAPPGLPVLAITQEHGAVPRDQIDYHVSVSETSIASYKEVQPADFVISLRSFQGGIEYSLFHGICSPAYLILKRTGEGDDHFFRHLFKSDRFIQQLTRNIEGLRDGKMISYKQFSEQLIPTPAPAEQRKIAACLASLDTLIAARGRKLAALAAHKEGLMQQLFPRPGESLPRLRFPEFREAGEWEAKPFSELCDIKHGYAFESEFFSSEGEYVLLTPGNFYEQGGYRDRGEQQKYYTGEIPLDYVLARGDMLIAMTEQAVGLLGSPILVPQSDRFLHNQRLGLVSARPGVAWVTEFFFHLFNTDFVRNAIQSTASGTKVRHTSPTKVGDITVPTPPSEAEQQRIASCLGSLDAALAAEAQALSALRTHKKGLMQQLFPLSEGA